MRANNTKQYRFTYGSSSSAGHSSLMKTMKTLKPFTHTHTQILRKEKIKKMIKFKTKETQQMCKIKQARKQHEKNKQKDSFLHCVCCVLQQNNRKHNKRHMREHSPDEFSVLRKGGQQNLERKV